MKMSRLIGALLCLLFLFASRCDSADQCEEDPNNKGCVCVFDKKSVDLRSLGHKDGTAAFSVVGSDKATYYYNPCKGFTEKDCKDVAGCQKDGRSYRSIGTPDKASFNTADNGAVSIAYIGGNGGRNMVVNLVCKKSQNKPEFGFVGETSKNQYTFNLTSVCACPGDCTENGPSGGGHSGKGGSGSHHSKASRIGIPGLVVLSLFLIAVTAYCVIGMIVMRVKYDKTGGDVIPNKRLWFALPSLVKDGVVLTFTPCRAACNKGGGYSKM
ncbi:uncharacterized protein [Dysidea avara]|uniref:uncharacterized protein n=1 Tax=Dysidea avara TaxID=196820 RepID=UPI00332DB6EC